MQKEKSPFPPIMDMGLRLTIAKQMAEGKKPLDSEFSGALHVLTFIDYIYLQMDLSFFYYALTGQIKIKNINEEVIEISKKFVGFHKEDGDSFEVFNEGLGYLNNGELKKAITCFQKAHEITPRMTLYSSELMQTLTKIGQIKKAKEIQESIDKIKSKSPQELVSEFQNEYKNNKSWIEKILNNSPNGLIVRLKNNTKDAAEWLKGTKNLTKKQLLDKINICLGILEWISLLSSLFYFEVARNFEHKNIDLKQAIIDCIGFTPELISLQDPEFLSLTNRKQSWQIQMGMDILTGKPIESLKNAVFSPIGSDSKSKTDSPIKFVWFLKETKENMDLDINISEQHREHRDSERNVIAEYIKKHFGDVQVLHQKKSGPVHIDIYIIPPNDERDFIMLITSGMSEKPMAAPPDAWRCWGIDISKVPKHQKGFFACNYAELILKIPMDWPLPTEENTPLDNDREYWPIYELISLINYVHDNNQWFWDGHTMRNRKEGSEPFADNTNLAGWVFFFPAHVPAEVGIIKVNDSKAICFLQITPAYIEEIEYAMEYGTHALFQKFTKNGITDILDINRKNACI